MKKKQTAVEWLVEKTTESGHLWLTDKPCDMDELSLIIEKAKQMEKERASNFGIRVFPECCSLKTGRVEIDLHKFENLLNEMYGE